MRFFMSLSCLVLFAGIASAYDFTSADQLFAGRDKTIEGRKKIELALDAYRQSLANVSGKDLIYAVAQISRLYVYKGDMTYPEDERRTRMKIFDTCLDTLDDHLKPSVFGRATPQYYYYKLYCLALWGKSAGPLRVLLRAPVLKKTISEGLKLDTRYEGGGMLRMTAAVYLNEKARPLGLYRPQRAMELIKQAIASEATDDPAYPIPLAGTDIAENYYHYAEALLKSDRGAEAIELLEQTISEYEELIELDALPAGREPEAIYYLGKLRRRLTGYRQEVANTR